MEQKVRKSSTKGRKIQQNNPLGKGRACSTCRARKVRCSGEHPACRACLRTARFEGRDLSQVVCQYDGRAGGGGKKGRKSAPVAEGDGEYGLAVLEEDGSEGAAYALGGMMAGGSSYTLPPLDPYAYPSFPQDPSQLAPSSYLPPAPNPVNSSFTPTPPLSYASSHSPEDSAYQQSPPQTATSAPPSVAYDQQPSTSGNGWTFSSRVPAPLSGSTSSPHLLPNGSGMYPSRRGGISSSGEHADAGAPFSSFASSSAYFDTAPRYAYNPPAPSTSSYSAYAPRRAPAVAYDQPAPSPSYPSYSTSSSYCPSPSTAPPHHPGNIPTPPPPATTTPVPYLSASETASSSSYPQPQGYYRPLPPSASSSAPRALLHNDPTFCVPLSARDPAPPLHHHHHPHHQRGQGLHLAPLPSPTLGMSAYALSSSSSNTTPYPQQQQQQVKPAAANTPGFSDVDSWLRGLAHP